MKCCLPNSMRLVVWTGRVPWWSPATCESCKEGTPDGIESGSPVGCGRTGTKHHLIIDGHCTPLAVILAGGNRRNLTPFMPLIDATPPVRGGTGPRGASPTRSSPIADTPTTFTATRSADVASCRPPPAAAAHGTGLGTYRWIVWVVGHSFAWLHNFKRIRIRRKWSADPYEAFLALACRLITHRQTSSSCQPLWEFGHVQGPSRNPWRAHDDSYGTSPRCRNVRIHSVSLFQAVRVDRELDSSALRRSSW